MMRRHRAAAIGLLAMALLATGCPKQIPQPEIDSAEQALADLDKLADCAPQTVQAARTTMERAQALLKEERYEEAKTALIAAKQLAEKARRECDEKKQRDEETARRQAELDAQAAARAAQLPATPAAGPTAMITVYFGFNTSELTDEARRALNTNAEYLQSHPDQRVQIEGHCDDRGSTEYNLALGERRALSAKQYLIKVGSQPDQLEIISYGEERLAETGQDEAAHEKNRRAEFRVLK